MSATPQFGKTTNTEIYSSNTEVANDLAATNDFNETKVKTDTLEKASSCVRSIAKPKPLSLDPMELQSITNLQNWCPLMRNPVNEGKPGNKITKKCTSQKENPNDSKSVLPSVKLTQFQPVVWNPPFRRNILAAETSVTPAKRAKICETDKLVFKSKDNSNEILESTLECEKNNRQTLNQLEDQTVSNNVPEPTNTAVNFQVENPEIFNEQKEISQQLAKSYIKICSLETSKTNDNFISYSPMEVNESQQVLIEDLSEKILVGDSIKASSPHSDEDMFLSQEPSGENYLAESQNQNPPKNILACKEEETCRDNLKEVLDVLNVKPNSGESIYSKYVNSSQESSDKDMLEVENQSEDPFDANWITEVAKLKTASQRSSGEGVFVEKKLKDDKEDIEEDMFCNEEEITPFINLDASHCENQLSKPGCISPPIGVVGVETESDLVARTPPRQIELDIYSCPTVKRVCTENPITLLSVQLMDKKFPKISEKVCAGLDTVAVDVTQEKEIPPQCRNNEVNAIVKMISHDEIVVGSSVHDAVNVKHVTEALKLTNYVSEMAVVNVGEADLNVSKYAFQEGQHTKSQQFTVISDTKDFVDLLVQNKTKIISEKTAVQEDESKAEDEKQLQLVFENNLTNVHYKSDDNSIVVDGIDLPKEVDISSANEKRKTNFEKLIKPNNIPQNETMRDEIDSKIQGPYQIGKHEIPPEAEIGRPKLIVEKAMLEAISTGEINLSQKENSYCQNKSEIQGFQIDCKDKIFQSADIESKKSIENDKVLSMEVDSSKRNGKDDDKKTNRKEEGNKMKPYTYEMEQDFDISQSQLIEIESAIMQESRQPGLASCSLSAKGIPRVMGGLPRVAETAPGVVMGMCGEARTPGFSMPSLPPMPTLNWKKKVQDDRQILRAVIHEISRLNAMLMSVRREVWPVAGVNPEAPPLSDTNRQGPGPSGRRY